MAVSKKAFSVHLWQRKILQHSNFIKFATISILSIDCKILSQQKITSLGQTETINVSAFANGGYIVRFVTNDEAINKTIQVLRQKK